MTDPPEWSIGCGRARYEKARTDKKFAYIVALARASNALNSVHSLMLYAGETMNSRARRDRLNSYFLASGLLYEAMLLIKKMNQIFLGDEMFEKTLKTILKDPVAQRIEQDHLNPARNRATFHFLPGDFDTMIQQSTTEECLFARSDSTKEIDLHYCFADVVAAEILVGYAEDSERFYEALGKAMSDTSDLMVKFMKLADRIIGFNLHRWGFEKKEIK